MILLSRKIIFFMSFLETFKYNFKYFCKALKFRYCILLHLTNITRISYHILSINSDCKITVIIF